MLDSVNTLTLFLIIFHSTLFSVCHASTKKPNIIIMLADDLGWADVGYHGSDIKTPSIDRLSNEGMRLERFYVNPICTPPVHHY